MHINKKDTIFMQKLKVKLNQELQQHLFMPNVYNILNKEDFYLNKRKKSDSNRKNIPYVIELYLNSPIIENTDDLNTDELVLLIIEELISGFSLKIDQQIHLNGINNTIQIKDDDGTLIFSTKNEELFSLLENGLDQFLHSI